MAALNIFAFFVISLSIFLIKDIIYSQITFKSRLSKWKSRQFSDRDHLLNQVKTSAKHESKHKINQKGFCISRLMKQVTRAKYWWVLDAFFISNFHLDMKIHNRTTSCTYTHICSYRCEMHYQLPVWATNSVRMTAAIGVVLSL